MSKKIYTKTIAFFLFFTMIFVNCGHIVTYASPHYSISSSEVFSLPSISSVKKFGQYECDGENYTVYGLKCSEFDGSFNQFVFFKNDKLVLNLSELEKLSKISYALDWENTVTATICNEYVPAIVSDVENYQIYDISKKLTNFLARALGTITALSVGNSFSLASMALNLAEDELIEYFTDIQGIITNFLCNKFVDGANTLEDLSGKIQAIVNNKNYLYSEKGLEELCYYSELLHKTYSQTNVLLDYMIKLCADEDALDIIIDVFYNFSKSAVGVWASDIFENLDDVEYLREAFSGPATLTAITMAQLCIDGKSLNDVIEFTGHESSKISDTMYEAYCAYRDASNTALGKYYNGNGYLAAYIFGELYPNTSYPEDNVTVSETQTTDDNFYVVGAQISPRANVSLRFIIQVKKSYLNEHGIYEYSGANVKFGTIVLPNDPKYKKESDVLSMHYETSCGYMPSAVPGEKMWDEDNTYVYYTLHITGVPEAQYERCYAVRPYIDLGDSTVYGSQYQTANVYKIAKYEKSNLERMGQEIPQAILDIIEYCE